MATLNQYRETVERVMERIAQLPTIGNSLERRCLFDEHADSYAVIELGWNKARRIHDLIAHVEIINGKIWVQEDNTDLAIADELAHEGIAQNDIVLGFHPPEVRPLTEYAAA